MSDSITVGDMSDSQATAIGDGATVVVNQYNLPPPRPESVNNLLPFNLNFIGRQACLSAIANNFTSAAGSIVVTQAISGLGGIGKTQVALAYAHTHRDQYDIIWQLQADSSVALNNSLRLLGETLELDIEGKDGPTLRSIVLSYLSAGKKEALLLYDNADQITPRDLRPYLPSGCHLLITSRRDDSQWSGMARPLTLGTFTEEEAMAFWQRRLQRDPEPKLEELAAALGYLPLALEQAAAFMLKRKKSAAAYRKQFNERRAALWAREKAPDNYQATVATTWQINFEHAQKTTGTADLLNLCSFFAPDDIPLAALREQAGSLQPPLDAVLADEDRREDALAALSDYSLLTVANEKLTMHRLVQLVVREQMEVEQAQTWLEAALNLLTKAYNFDEHDMSTWAQCGQLLPHLTTATNLAAKWEINSEQAAYLNNEAGRYLQQYGDYAAARPFYERALAIDEKTLGPDHPHTATSLNNLGLLLDSMGEYGEAWPFYERALTIREKQLGTDHPDTANSLNNLGELLRMMGAYKEARPFYERALAIREKQLGPDHPDTATSLNNLGLLLQTMGEYGEARPFYERALAIWEKQLGPDHPDTATSLNNLALLSYHEGDMQEAARLMRRALAIREKALGNAHPHTQTARQSLAAIEAALGSKRWQFWKRR
ncbi:MAG: tetratricopeptide repeat protein [Chloroflexi bacterium]|nr:tetratricopeptide repeat protein [Chloroflexota bacterium]